MNTTQQVTIKKQAIFVLRQLRPKFQLPGNVSCTNESLSLLEKQLMNEIDNLKPQAFNVDWLTSLLSNWREVLDSCEIVDDKIIKRIESCALFAYQLSRCDGLIDCTVTITVFVGSLFEGSITRTLSQKIVDQFHKIFTYSEDDTELVPQSMEEFFDTFREKLDFTASLVDLPIMKKMHKFLMYALSYSLLENFGISFESIGYAKFEAEAIRRAYTSKFGLWHALLDAMSLFCRQFVSAVKTRSFEPFFHSTSSYDAWVTLAFKLKRQEKFLSNPEPHNFDIFTFRSELDEAIAKGKSIIQFISNAGKLEKDKIKQLLSELELIKANDITKKSTQRDREAPFSILLAGGSSVGKSHLTNIMFQYFADLKGLPSGSEFKYTRNFTEEFWNGFTSSQWFIILDDIASLSPKLGVLDPSLAEVINVVNNVAFVPNQAELADKGKTPCLAKLVIATTNTPDLNAYAYFSCPLAIQRRIPWVVNVMPKPEFARNSVMLDPSKCVSTEGKFDDFWDIVVEKIVPASDSLRNQRAKLEPIHKFNSIVEYLSWFGATAMQHSAQQNSLAKSEQDMKAISVCKKEGCYKPLYACSCLQQQSLNETSTTNERRWYDIYPFWVVFRLMLYRMTNFAYTYDPEHPAFVTFPKILSILEYFFFGMIGWLIVAYASITFKVRDVIISYTMGLQERATRAFVRQVAIRVQNHLEPFKQYAKIFAIGTATISVAYTAYKLMPKKEKTFERCSEGTNCKIYREDNLVEQVSIEHIGQAPEPQKCERDNVWYKNEFNVTSFDVDTLTKSWKEFSKDEVRTILFRNLLRFRIQISEGHWRNTGAFALGGTLYAINYHALPKFDTFTMEILQGCDNSGVNTNTTLLINSTQIYKLPEKDLAIINIVAIPPKKDISGLLVKDTFDGKYVGELLKRSIDMSTDINPVKDITRSLYQWTESNIPCWSGISSRLTIEGDCGSIMLVFSPLGPVILGIHALGNACSQVVSMPITNNVYQDAKRYFCIFNIQSGSPNFTGEYAGKYILGPLNERSPLRYIENGCANTFGSFIGHRSNARSSVGRTCIAQEAEKFGYVQKYGPPVMKGWLPWRTALIDMVNIPTTFRTDILDQCVASFTKDILDRLTPEQLSEVQIYDIFTSVNGAAGVSYVDKMNRNTSMGFPWCKSKKHFIHSVPPRGELLDPVEFDDEVLQRVQSCIDKYHAGQRYMPIFTGHLKDEPTSYKKIKLGKTRLFGGAPADWSIVVRMYLLSVIRLIQNNRFIFESAPGTIAQSAEWGEIYHYLTQFGKDRIIAGDYKAFDKSMSSMFIKASYTIISNVCKAAGYSSDDLLVIEGISTDTSYPLFNVNGDLVELYGSNPSGHPLTVIINGLANALYMRYCYTILNPQHECSSFKENISLMTYGDDNVMGVRPGIDWFDHTKIAEVLAVHGVTYTMADKEAVSVPFINISNVSFLKRSWLWCPEVNNYLCPLEHDSIEKSIMTCVASKSVSAEYQAIQIVSTACQEYFFYGREVFEQKTEILKQIVINSGLEDFIEDNTFPTWDSLVNRFLQYKITSSYKEQLKLAHYKVSGFEEVPIKKESTTIDWFKSIKDFTGVVIREMPTTNC